MTKPDFVSVPDSLLTRKESIETPVNVFKTDCDVDLCMNHLTTMKHKKNSHILLLDP